MTRFEDNLWREIERSHGSKLAGSGGPLQRGTGVRLPVIAGTGLGLAGASVAAVIVLSATSSTPAYAVTRHADGTVSVMIRQVGGIPGANRRLAQLGIRARAVQVAGGCQAPVSGSLRKVTIATFVRDHRAVRLGGGPGWVDVRIRPSQIPSHRTLVIPALRSGAAVRLVRGRAVRGAIPNCLPPAVILRNAPRGTHVRILSCGTKILQRRPSIVAPTNTVTSSGTATDSGTTTNSGTTTATGTTTNSEPTTVTGTTTNFETVTGPSTTTNSGTSTQSMSAGAPAGALPPIVQTCLRAARRATQ